MACFFLLTSRFNKNQACFAFHKAKLPRVSLLQINYFSKGPGWRRRRGRGGRRRRRRRRDGGRGKRVKWRDIYFSLPPTLIHLVCGWQALICKVTESRQAPVNFDDDCRSPGENTQWRRLWLTLNTRSSVTWGRKSVPLLILHPSSSVRL